MKLRSLTLGMAVAAAIFITGCANEKSVSNTTMSNEVVTEASLGLRKTTIYAENTTSASKTEYVKDAPGTSTLFDRAFQDAPPMIPHSTEGLLPVTIDNNSCVGCHDPAVAPSMGATALPKSHFIDFRPKHNFDGKTFTKSIDNMKNETSVKPISQLAGARYNCTQCHAPQSNGNLAVESTFKANYTRLDGPTKSSWDEVILDNLDTLKK